MKNFNEISINIETYGATNLRDEEGGCKGEYNSEYQKTCSFYIRCGDRPINGCDPHCAYCFHEGYFGKCESQRAKQHQDEMTSFNANTMTTLMNILTTSINNEQCPEYLRAAMQKFYYDT